MMPAKADLATKGDLEKLRLELMADMGRVERRLMQLTLLAVLTALIAAALCVAILR